MGLWELCIGDKGNHHAPRGKHVRLLGFRFIRFWELGLGMLGLRIIFGLRSVRAVGLGFIFLGLRFSAFGVQVWAC